MYNETLIISLIVPLVYDTFNLYVYHIHTIPMVNTALCKAFKIEQKILILPYLMMKKYHRIHIYWAGIIYTHSIDMDIMKSLISKGYYCSLSVDYMPYITILIEPLHYTSRMIFKLNPSAQFQWIILASNFIVQLNPNQDHLAIIKWSPVECRYPVNTENNIISPPLAKINLPAGLYSASTGFIIPAVNSFSSKLPITLWDYQCDPFISISDPLIPVNFNLISNFGLNNLTQMKSNFILSKLLPITDVPIVNFMDTLNHIDIEHNNNYPLWLIIVITICST